MVFDYTRMAHQCEKTPPVTNPWYGASPAVEADLRFLLRRDDWPPSLLPRCWEALDRIAEAIPIEVNGVFFHLCKSLIASSPTKPRIPVHLVHKWYPKVNALFCIRIGNHVADRCPVCGHVFGSVRIPEDLRIAHNSRHSLKP